MILCSIFVFRIDISSIQQTLQTMDLRPFRQLAVYIQKVKDKTNVKTCFSVRLVSLYHLDRLETLILTPA